MNAIKFYSELRMLQYTTSNGYVSSSQLKRNLGVTDRTIRSYVKEINTEFEIIKSMPSKGYKIIDDVLFEPLKNGNVEVDILYLIGEAKYSRKRISDKIFISSSSLNKFIQKISEFKININHVDDVLKYENNIDNYIRVANYLFNYEITYEKIAEYTQNDSRYIMILYNLNCPIEYIEKIKKIFRNDSYVDTNKITQTVINILNNNYDYLKLDTSELILRISMHLTNSIDRIRSNILIVNPMTDVIISRYRKGYLSALLFCEKLEETMCLTIPIQEIAYIALYFENAINNEHYKSVKVLYNFSYSNAIVYTNIAMLHSKFNQIELSANLQGNQRYDLTISDDATIKSDVYVNGLFTNDNIKEIDKLINYALISKHIVNTNFKLSSSMRLSKNTKYELLTKICEDNKFSSEIIDSIIKREKLYSTDINGTIAIPHAIDSSIEHPEIYIYKSEEPIKWSDTNIEYIVLLIMPTKNTSNINFIEILYTILNENEKIESFLSFIERKKNVDNKE